MYEGTLFRVIGNKINSESNMYLAMFRVVLWDILPCNQFTRQYIPEDNSEHRTRRRENLKSHISCNIKVTDTDSRSSFAILFEATGSIKKFTYGTNGDMMSCYVYCL
jgi:hypothetical protein